MLLLVIIKYSYKGRVYFGGRKKEFRMLFFGVLVFLYFYSNKKIFGYSFGRKGLVLIRENV